MYCIWNTGWLLLFFSFSLAAMYGSGSYFAVDLVYSAQGYAKPNAMRHKRMYLARILVGDFTQGRAGLITPPAKSSRNSADLVDTDQNPMSLQCPLQQCEEGFISCDTHTKQKIQERLRSSSEISHSYNQVMNQPDSVSRYQIPQRAVDHSTQYDHQQILIMQDDPTVRKAATSLYEKRPAVTSVYVLDQNQRPKLIQGASVPLSEDSRLTLVGHGERDTSGETRLAGYTAQDVAKIIQRTFRTGDKIKTTSVVACEVGSDKEFVETLLRELRETANIETELHLRSAVLQVRHTGEIITQEISKEGLRWRHNDDSKKVVATLDRNGDVIIRTEPGRRGEEVFTNERNFLMPPKKNTQKNPGGKGEASNTQTTYRNSWPDEPQIFIDQDVYKNLNSYVKTGCIETSALSWIIFHEKLPLPEKINTEILNLNNFVIGERIKKKDNKIINNKDNKIIDNKDNKYVIKWIEKEQDIKHLLFKCYVIKSGRDVRSIIRHYAKDGEDKITYLMVKDWIYAVHPVNLYIHLVGKQFNHEKDQNRQTWEAVKKFIEHQVNMEQYNQILRNINDKENKLIYPKYVKGILLGQHRENLKLSIEMEAWYTTYFTASVIAESARNFRTFPLILMALDMTENEHHGKSLEFLFEKPSMARGGSWIDPNLRGFRGSAKLPPDASPSSKAKLKEVLYREGDLYNFWIKTKDNAVLDDEKVFKIVEKFNLTEGDSDEIKTIVKNYNYFKTKINSGPSASGP